MAMGNVAISLVAIMFTINFMLAQSMVTQTSNLDNYIKVVDKLTVVSDRLRLLEAVWGEIRADGAANLNQIKDFYHNVNKSIITTKADEQEEKAELLATVRDVLVTDNAHLLAETLNGNGTQNVAQVTSFRTNLLDNYDEELLYGIFEQAIDASYPYKNTSALFELLNAVDTNTYASLQRAFNVRLHWNLYLYYKFLSRGDINDEYLYLAARELTNLKRHSYFKNLPRDTTRRVEAAVNTFPISLYNLFNTTQICIENEQYDNYYLYFDSASAGFGNYVSAVVRNSFVAYSDWKNSYGSAATTINSDLILTAVKNGWYLYRQLPNVLVQRDVTVTANRNWQPVLHDSKIMLRYQNYYMCATSEFESTLMGFKVKALSGISLDDPYCQWRLTNCAELHK